MQLVRFGPKGQEKPGLMKNKRIVDLRALFADIPDIGESFFSQGWPKRLGDLDAAGEKLDARLGPPLHRPSKIICLGKNYAEHAKEGGFDSPEAPLIFNKTPNALNGPFDPVQMPQSSDQIDWEVELAVVIGRTGKRIAASDAAGYIAGYTVMNDVSARRAQFAQSQWFRGKTFDTFAPLGPAIVTPDEIGDVQQLRLTASVNGHIMQDGTTADMIFSVAELIENISQDITLVAGDVIATGTPAGVGIFRDPPVVLAPGDEVECRIEKIGAICNRFLAP